MSTLDKLKQFFSEQYGVDADEYSTPDDFGMDDIDLTELEGIVGVTVPADIDLSRTTLEEMAGITADD